SMLNVVNGFYYPQEGTITYKGRRRHHMRPYIAASQGIARTFQNVALFKGMSTLDNIMTGRTLKMRRGILAQAVYWGWSQKEEIRHREAVERIIDFLESEHIRKTPVGKLPYGLQKRVELARALATEPELLLLDEPMAGMNLEEKQDMSRFILDVNDELGTTIVLIEHDMGVVMDISDRVVLRDYGRKMRDGAPDEVRNNPDVVDARPGGANRGIAHGVFRRSRDRWSDGRGALFPGRPRFRADLHGLGRVQLRAGCDGAVRRSVDGAPVRMAAAVARL